MDSDKARQRLGVVERFNLQGLRYLLAAMLVLAASAAAAHDLTAEMLNSLERQSPAAATSQGAVVWQYLVLGIEHIVPLGADHILFVLGLFLFSKKMIDLLKQVSAFTIAHTVTLAVTSLGWIEPPPEIVEPLIAASICFIAVENLYTREVRWHRTSVVFLFGLLHGMGFAGVLGEIGIPDDRFLAALLAFNVGVEIGQLIVILTAFLLVGWFRASAWYRPRIAMPLSLLIAAVASYWTSERLVGVIW